SPGCGKRPPAGKELVKWPPDTEVLPGSGLERPPDAGRVLRGLGVAAVRAALPDRPRGEQAVPRGPLDDVDGEVGEGLADPRVHRDERPAGAECPLHGDRRPAHDVE